MGKLVVPHVGLRDQLLPVCCRTEVLSYEDNEALTFDSSGTETHPATDAILFSAVSHAHLATTVTCYILTFGQFVRHCGS